MTAVPSILVRQRSFMEGLCGAFRIVYRPRHPRTAVGNTINPTRNRRHAASPKCLPPAYPRFHGREGRTLNSLILLAHPRGFEPLASAFGEQRFNWRSSTVQKDSNRYPSGPSTDCLTEHPDGRDLTQAPSIIVKAGMSCLDVLGHDWRPVHSPQKLPKNTFR